MKKITIGLIGNPNTGKTTLFNQLTGADSGSGTGLASRLSAKRVNFLPRSQMSGLSICQAPDR